MKALLLAGGLLAFDPLAAERLLWDAEFACLEGQNHDGESISQEVQDQACKDRAALLKAFRDNGYCFEDDNAGWAVCL